MKKWLLLCLVLISLMNFAWAAVDKTPPTTTASLTFPVPKWINHISLSGAINVAGFASSHTPTTIIMLPSNVASSPAATDLSVTFANLTVNANMTHWLDGILAFSYQRRSPSFVRSPVGGGDTLIVDKAYVTLHHPNFLPGYAKIGRRFVNFGGLDNTSYLESPVQLLTLTRQTIVAVGFENWHHFNTEIFGFAGLIPLQHTNTTEINSFGVQASYGNSTPRVSYQVEAAYVTNLVGALYTSTTVAKGSSLSSGYYTHTVPFAYLNLTGKYSSVDMNLKYVGALNSFALADLPFTNNSGTSFQGAKPAGWGVNGGYSFDIKGYGTRFALGYQGSKQAVALGKVSGSATNAISGVYGTSYAIGMPETRYYANYRINKLLKYADVGFEVGYDRGYSTKNGGTGRGAPIGMIMLATKFS